MTTKHIMNITLYYGLFPLTIITGCIGLAKWRQNYKSACHMGFPVFHSLFPYYDNNDNDNQPFSPTGKEMSKSWLPLRVLKKLIMCRAKPWLSTLKASWVWKMGYLPFEHAGDDSFVLTSLAGNQLWTSDLSIIKDLLEQDRTLHVVLEDLQSDSNAFAMSATSKVNNGKQMAEKEKEQEEKERRKDFKSAINSALMDQRQSIEAQRQILAFAASWMKRNNSTTSVIPTFTSKLAFDILKGSTFATSSLKSQAGVLGNMLGFFLLLMALYPDKQRKVQEELDAHFDDQTSVNNDKCPLTIKVDDLSILAKGYIGATQKEILSIYPVVSHVARCVRPSSLSSSSSTVMVTDSKGIRHPIPTDTIVVLDIAAMYRNPRVWWNEKDRPEQSRERRAATAESPALYFNPERWLDMDAKMEDVVRQGLGAEQQQQHHYHHQALHERALQLGLELGLGPRPRPKFDNDTDEQQTGGMGQDFAHVLLIMITVVAALFKHYSLELVVDEITLKGCRGMKPLAWDKTRDDALRMLYEDIEGDEFLSMTEELPVRIVAR